MAIICFNIWSILLEHPDGIFSLRGIELLTVSNEICTNLSVAIAHVINIFIHHRLQDLCNLIDSSGFNDKWSRLTTFKLIFGIIFHTISMPISIYSVWLEISAYSMRYFGKCFLMIMSLGIINYVRSYASHCLNILLDGLTSAFMPLQIIAQRKFLHPENSKERSKNGVTIAVSPANQTDQTLDLINFEDIIDKVIVSFTIIRKLTKYAGRLIVLCMFTLLIWELIACYLLFHNTHL